MGGGQVGGAPPAPSTVYRWTTRGSGGRGDGWPSRSPGNRLGDASAPARGSRGQMGALPWEAQPPCGGGGSGRAESFSDWGGFWLSSHPFSCPLSRCDSSLVPRGPEGSDGGLGGRHPQGLGEQPPPHLLL